MKTKKSFLILCAAALTLAVALPFMGVFAFAEDDSVSVPYNLLGNSNVSYYVNSTEYTIYLSSGSISYPVQIPLSLSLVIPGTSTYREISYYDSFDNLVPLSVDSASPTFLDTETLGYFYFGGATDDASVVYVIFDHHVDPLAPVSDGMDTMISVFGDVIDYIINTPDVAIFVAISVASCAIIPMGIILIKKLIKGY